MNRPRPLLLLVVCPAALLVAGCRPDNDFAPPTPPDMSALFSAYAAPPGDLEPGAPSRAGRVLAARGISVQTLAIQLMFDALFAMGVHSTFIGPFKYAIVPHHLEPDEVLAVTGLVEAGTYVAILVGMMLGGAMPIMWSITAVVAISLIGYMVCRWVPPAPAQTEETKVDWNPIRASRDLIAFSMGNLELRYSVMAISYFGVKAAIFWGRCECHL